MRRVVDALRGWFMRDANGAYAVDERERLQAERERRQLERRLEIMEQEAAIVQRRRFSSEGPDE